MQLQALRARSRSHDSLVSIPKTMFRRLIFPTPSNKLLLRVLGNCIPFILVNLFATDAMASSLRLGQFLRGQNGIYTIAKQLQDTVWLARHGFRKHARKETLGPDPAQDWERSTGDCEECPPLPPTK